MAEPQAPAAQYKQLAALMRSRDKAGKYTSTSDEDLVRALQLANPGKYDQFVVPEPAAATGKAGGTGKPKDMGSLWDFLPGLVSGAAEGTKSMIDRSVAPVAKGIVELLGLPPEMAGGVFSDQLGAVQKATDQTSFIGNVGEQVGAAAPVVARNIPGVMALGPTVGPMVTEGLLSAPQGAGAAVRDGLTAAVLGKGAAVLNRMGLAPLAVGSAGMGAVAAPEGQGVEGAIAGLITSPFLARAVNGAAPEYATGSAPLPAPSKVPAALGNVGTRTGQVAARLLGRTPKPAAVPTPAPALATPPPTTTSELPPDFNPVEALLSAPATRPQPTLPKQSLEQLLGIAGVEAEVVPAPSTAREAAGAFLAENPLPNKFASESAQTLANAPDVPTPPQVPQSPAPKPDLMELLVKGGIQPDVQPPPAAASAKTFADARPLGKSAEDSGAVFSDPANASNLDKTARAVLDKPFMDLAPVDQNMISQLVSQGFPIDTGVGVSSMVTGGVGKTGVTSKKARVPGR